MLRVKELEFELLPFWSQVFNHGIKGLDSENKYTNKNKATLWNDKRSCKGNWSYYTPSAFTFTFNLRFTKYLFCWNSTWYLLDSLLLRISIPVWGIFLCFMSVTSTFTYNLRSAKCIFCWNVTRLAFQFDAFYFVLC